MNDLKPVGFEKDLGDFGPQLFDGYCGEPIGWGFKILTWLGKERWEELGRHGSLEYLDWNRIKEHGEYALITDWLTREEAEQKYGPVTEEEYGPLGGWKSVKFGDKLFWSKKLERRLSNEERNALIASRKAATNDDAV